MRQKPSKTIKSPKTVSAAAEMKKHTEDFRKWLAERNLALSVRTVVNDNEAQHFIRLIKK